MPAVAWYPGQRLCVDFVGPWPDAKGGERYILTVLDTFSRWLEAFQTKTNTAAEVVCVLTDEVFIRYGLPERIHSDEGSHFTAEVMSQLAKDLKVHWELGPAYLPKSNNVESHHRALNALIGKLAPSAREWKSVLKTAVFIHNMSICRSTGMAPYNLLFGRDATTSLDLLFRDPHQAMESRHPDPDSVRERILRAAEWALKNLSKTVP